MPDARQRPTLDKDLFDELADREIYPCEALTGGGGRFNLVFVEVGVDLFRVVYQLLREKVDKPHLSLYFVSRGFRNLFIVRGRLGEGKWAEINVLRPLQKALPKRRTRRPKPLSIELAAFEASPLRLHAQEIPATPKPLRVTQCQNKGELLKAMAEGAVPFYDPNKAHQYIFMVLIRSTIIRTIEQQDEHQAVVDHLMQSPVKVTDGVVLRDIFKLEELEPNDRARILSDWRHGLFSRRSDRPHSRC
jgi:hypothetical protein